MDSCGAGLSSFQFDFQLVCFCNCAYCFYHLSELPEALEDPSLNLSWIHILNTVLIELLNYFYVSSLVMCFPLLLGNRPRLVASGQSTQALLNFLSNHIFRNIVLSLAAILGLYLIASIIFVSYFFPPFT